MFKKYRKTKFFLIFVLIIVSFFTISNFRKGKKKLTNYKENIYELKKKNLILSHDLEGIVESEKRVVIFPSVNGTVKTVYKRVGDDVKKGELLAVLDSTGIIEYEAMIEKAKINLKEKTKKYNDLKELYSLGAVSKSELDAASDSLKIANLDYKNAIVNSKDFSNQISSPVDGVIVDAAIDENLKVDRSKGLYTIVDLENLKIISEIPNTKLSSLKIGNDVLISAENLAGKVLKEKITTISRISEVSKKYNDSITKFSVKLNSNSGLKPGDIVKLKVIYEELKDVLSLPISYIETNISNKKTYVYRLNKKNQVEKVEVTLGKTNNFEVVVSGDIKEGDKILNNVLKIYKEGDILK